MTPWSGYPEHVGTSSCHGNGDHFLLLQACHYFTAIIQAQNKYMVTSISTVSIVRSRTQNAGEHLQISSHVKSSVDFLLNVTLRALCNKISFCFIIALSMRRSVQNDTWLWNGRLKLSHVFVSRQLQWELKTAFRKGIVITYIRHRTDNEERKQLIVLF